MYDCSSFCLGPGCENWMSCGKDGYNTANSPRDKEEK